MNRLSLSARRALLALACSMSACGGPQDPFEFEQGTPVVMIVIDTLRADHLSCYGYELETSPVLDAFAREAYFFESNSTQFNSTFPSLTSIFTGLYPKTHGNYLAVPVEGTANRSEGARCLAERFKDVDYQTVAVLSHPSWESVDRDIALMRGWDRFSNIADPIPVAERPLFAHAEYTHERLWPLLDEAVAKDDPLFLWVHYFDPHTDIAPTVYNAPPETRNLYLRHHLEQVGEPDFYDGLAPLEPAARTQWIRENAVGDQRMRVDLANGRALYDAEIRSCDAGIAKLFERLKSEGLYDEAIIVIMADHGENMEPASLGHGPINFTHNRLFESVSHTPLMIRLPGQKKGERISAITQNIDVAPTLLELLDMPPKPEVEGRSLVPLMRDPSAKLHERVFIESSKGKEKAVKTERHKLIDSDGNDEPLLFAWRDDPTESSDLKASADAELVAGLAQAIRGVPARPYPAGALRARVGALHRDSRNRVREGLLRERGGRWPRRFGEGRPPLPGDGSRRLRAGRVDALSQVAPRGEAHRADALAGRRTGPALARANPAAALDRQAVVRTLRPGFRRARRGTRARAGARCGRGRVRRRRSRRGGACRGRASVPVPDLRH